MRDVVASKVEGMSRILEVGPGPVPFPPATEFIDWREWPELQGKPVHPIDINSEPLPFDDKSLDFVYCRHTLEDIYNPVWLCKEMGRVAKAGYIETPSPVAEFVRGIDPEDKPWRGYCHHRHLFWVAGKSLKMLPKIPIIEWINLPQLEGHAIDVLNEGPLFWNTYYLWENQLDFQLMQHDQEFKILPDYPNLVERAVMRSEAYNRELSTQYGV